MKPYNPKLAFNNILITYICTFLMLSIIALCDYLFKTENGILLVTFIFTIGLMTGFIHEKD